MNESCRVFPRFFQHCLGNLRSIGGVFLCALLMACGGNTDENESVPSTPPAQATIARIEVSPAAVVLTSETPTATLRARALDANGNEIRGVSLTFLSSMPSQVSVGTDGGLRAMAPVGSALVTAVAGGVSSPAVVVTALQPSPGTRLISDEEVTADPQPVTNADGSVGPNYRVQVLTTAAPTAGALVMASGGQAIAGRVRQVSAGTTATTSTLLIEPVPLTTLVRNASIALSFTPAQLKAVTQLNPIPSQAARARALSARRMSLRFGAFDCDVSSGINGFNFSGSVSADPNLSGVLRSEVVDSVLQAFEISARGGVTLTASADVTYTESEQEMSCRATAALIPIPVTGWFRVVLEPAIPIHADITAKLGQTPLRKTTLTRQASLDVTLGLRYERGVGTTNLNDVRLTGSGTLAADAAGEGTLDFELFAGVSTGLELRSRVFNAEKSLVEVAAGPRLVWSGEIPGERTRDEQAPSRDDTQMVVKIGPGAALQDLIDSLAAGLLLDIDLEEEFVATLGRSATLLVPASVNSAILAAGQTATFSVRLDPATVRNGAFGGAGYDVAEVRIYRLSDSGSVVVANPVAVATAADGQTDFLLDWIPSETENITTPDGRSRFYALAVPKFLQGLRSTRPVKLGKVIAPPVIDTQPANASTIAAGQAIFTVAARGDGPLSYQWLRNGSQIPGATAPSLSFPASLEDNNARFTVVVSASGLSTTSASALLVVQPQPTGYGSVTVSGTAQALGGTPFVPISDRPPAAVSSGPNCFGPAEAPQCISQLNVNWGENIRGQFPQFVIRTLSVVVLSFGDTSTTPGSRQNRIAITYQVAPLSEGPSLVFSRECGDTSPDCLNPVSAGMSVNVATRTVSFNNTVLRRADTTDSVILNGSLQY